jgi:hypothetical protein
MSENLCFCCGKPTDGSACTVCGLLRRRRLVGDARDSDFIGLIEAVPAVRDLAHGRTRRGTAGGRAPGPRMELNLDAMGALDQAQNLLTTLARDIAETRGIAEPDATRGDALIAAAQFVAMQMEWIRHAYDGAEPYAVRAFREIDESAGELVGLARGPSDRRYYGPCGADVAREVAVGITEIAPCPGDLYARQGSPTARCRFCGASASVAAREAWLDDVRRSHAFRAAHIAQAYGIPVDTIRSWAHRGQLVAHGHDPDGRPLYNVGEVLDLYRADRVRRAENQARRARRQPTGDAA